MCVCVCVCVLVTSAFEMPVCLSASIYPPSLPPFPTVHLAVLPVPRVLVPVGDEEGAFAADHTVHPLSAAGGGREGGMEGESDEVSSLPPLASYLLYFRPIYVHAFLLP